MSIGICHDCGVEEGKVHDLGCDMEICPICGSQLICCDCSYKILGLFNTSKYTAETNFLPPSIYNNGLSFDLLAKWVQILEEIGRIPYIEWPNMCARCGKLWPDMFNVPDSEWEYYIEPGERDKMLCKDCYDTIKELIDA